MGVWISGGLKYIEGGGYTPCLWSTGTDAEIVEALQKHYNNEIDITEYWADGDERTVSLSAMTDTTYSSETHAAQNIILVLVNAGGKELVTPINGHTMCAFIVGQKDCLLEKGKMYESADSTGWASSNRRNWCNNTYYNAIPSTLRSIFKLHNNYLGNSYETTSTYILSEDYFCLPSAKEITGSPTTDAESKNNQFIYYTTYANKIKNISGTANSYWTSSKYNSNSSYRNNMYTIGTSGSSARTGVANNYGLAPQGVI